MAVKLALEAREERQHGPVVGKNEPDERGESGLSRLLGQHANELNTQPLSLPGVVDHYRELGVIGLANRVLRHRDDA